MRWLVSGAHKHDSLFIHCTFVPRANLNVLTLAIDSGHGSQVRDLNGDEVDGYDEGNAFKLPSDTHSLMNGSNISTRLCPGRDNH
jgi:hypothetical protein